MEVTEPVGRLGAPLAQAPGLSLANGCNLSAWQERENDMWLDSVSSGLASVHSLTNGLHRAKGAA